MITCGSGAAAGSGGQIRRGRERQAATPDIVADSARPTAEEGISFTRILYACPSLSQWGRGFRPQAAPSHGALDEPVRLAALPNQRRFFRRSRRRGVRRCGIALHMARPSQATRPFLRQARWTYWHLRAGPFAEFDGDDLLTLAGAQHSQLDLVAGRLGALQIDQDVVERADLLIVNPDDQIAAALQIDRPIRCRRPGRSWSLWWPPADPIAPTARRRSDP